MPPRQHTIHVEQRHGWASIRTMRASAASGKRWCLKIRGKRMLEIFRFSISGAHTRAQREREKKQQQKKTALYSWFSKQTMYYSCRREWTLPASRCRMARKTSRGRRKRMGKKVVRGRKDRPTDWKRGKRVYTVAWEWGWTVEKYRRRGRSVRRTPAAERQHNTEKCAERVNFVMKRNAQPHSPEVQCNFNQPPLEVSVD